MKREDEAASNGSSTPGKGGLLVMVGALVVSLGIGGSLGALVLGPRFAAASDSRPAEASAADDAPRKKKSGHSGGGAELFALESLVVNPAGSNGTRFLIVSLAVEPEIATDVETLKAHEPEIRDRLLRVLATKSVEQLSAIELRDSLKAEIIAAIDEAVPSAKVHRLFMPQYVLQ